MEKPEGRLKTGGRRAWGETFHGKFPPAPFTIPFVFFLLFMPEFSWADSLNPRLFAWVGGQMHLWFAAFALSVPVFVVTLEFLGVLTKEERYDAMAREFLRVSITAYALTALTGIFFAVVLFVFYPRFMNYMTGLFRPTFAPYIALFIVENILLYLYYRSWQRLREGRKKVFHIFMGFLLNSAGVAIMFIADGWATFMMAPSGVDERGALTAGLWQAISNPLWMPLNIHRFIANIAFGGAIIASYAAYRFLGAAPSQRPYYDRMGAVASFVSIGSLLPLPFAGYWLTAEIYSFSQRMGVTLMGGAFGWLFIVQAVVIGAIFISANYYLWCALERCPGKERYAPYIKYFGFVIGAAFLVWFTPHTPFVRPEEARAIGGAYHPVLGPLGLMPAKNIAVNVIIIFTFLSFIIYRRANKVPTVRWADYGKTIQAALIAAAVVNIVFSGVYYGYFASAAYRVASSVPQVLTTLLSIIVFMSIEAFLYRGAKEVGPVEWGKIPHRSQYAIVLFTVSFVWLMGLMGFIRSAIREDWHVYAIMRDTTPEAFTPSIEYATRVVSVSTVAFMAAVVFIFWLNTRGRAESDEKLP